MVAAKRWEEFLDAARRLFYPPSCALCRRETLAEILCDPCREAIQAESARPTCPFCAAIVGPGVDLRNGCVQCRSEPFAFQAAVCLGPYEGLLAEACRSLKHPASHYLGPILADLLYGQRHEILRALAVDCVVPVPLHWTRRLLRGYDQSAHWGTRLAERLGRPMRIRALRRVRRTRSQSRLSPTERRVNVRNAFVAGAPGGIEGAHVLLVDDVLTTGATCHQAARALRQGGARAVSVAVLGRGGTRIG